MAAADDAKLGMATHHYDTQAAIAEIAKELGFSNIAGIDSYPFKRDDVGGVSTTGQCYTLRLYGRVDPTTSTIWDNAPIGSTYKQIVVGVAGGPPTDSNLWLKKAAGWVNISA